MRLIQHAALTDYLKVFALVAHTGPLHCLKENMKLRFAPRSADGLFKHYA